MLEAWSPGFINWYHLPRNNILPMEIGAGGGRGAVGAARYRNRIKLNPFKARCIQLFRKRLSEKVHTTTTIPKGIVGGFEITVAHRNFERMARETMDYVSEC